MLDQKYLTPQQVAEILCCSAWQVRSLIRAGKIHAIDISNGTGCHALYRIRPESLAKFQADQSGREHEQPPKPSDKLITNSHLARWRQAKCKR